MYSRIDWSIRELGRKFEGLIISGDGFSGSKKGSGSASMVKVAL
jgi:hypothetical protein